MTTALVQVAAIVGFGSLFGLFLRQLAVVIRAEYREALKKGQRP